MELVSGLQILQETDSLKVQELFSTHNALQMSIRIKPDGISFLMVSYAQRKVLYYKNYAVDQTPLRIKLLEKAILNEQPFLLYAEAIKWSFYAEQFTIVPESVYDAKLNYYYLNYTCDLKENELIAAVYSDVIKAYFIFAIDNQLNEFITKYSPTRFKLANVSVADKLLRMQEITGLGVYVDLLKDGFYILIGNKGKLMLNNYFKTETPEDVAYHVLFCMEQFGLNPEKIPVYLSGYISEGDPNHKILSKFIKNCEFSALPKGVDMHPLAGEKSMHHIAFTQICEIL